MARFSFITFILLTSTNLSFLSANEDLDDIDDGPMRCERYNQTCVDEVYKNGRSGGGEKLDFSACIGVQICEADTDHNCFVVWTVDNEDKSRPPNNESLTSTTTLQPLTTTTTKKKHSHSSGRKVELMGCLLKRDDCDASDQCLDEK